MKHKCILGLLAIASVFQSCARAQEKDTLSKSSADTLIVLKWTELAPGIAMSETDAPFKSVVNDSKLTVLKLDPHYFDYELLIATALDRKARTAPEWAEEYKLDIVMNAGMYELSKKLLSRGYLQHKQHKNNPKIHPTFNSMIAFNPKDSTAAPFQVYDLQCKPWEKIKNKYHSYAQGLRMLDCDGNPIGWNKRKQSCSMLATAMDEDGMLYFVYTRSPYTHNEFIRFLRQMPMKLKNAIYMEGGPETSLYVNINGTKIEKFGSYVSETYPNDLNDHFWELPNVIGLRYKTP